MTAGVEVLAADEWLATLAADLELAAAAPGGVWNEQAPPDAEGVVVTFALLASSDVQLPGATRLWTDARYVIKAIAPGDSYEPARPAAARIDQLVAAADGTPVPGGGAVLAARRLEAVHYPENTPNGTTYRHLGGIYRLWAQAL